MRRRTTFNAVVVMGLAIILSQRTAVRAQDPSEKLPPADLEQLVAPIALYPDQLLTLVIPASTLPVQVVEAAQYSAKNPGKAEPPANSTWDDSIVSLLAFPDALKKLNEDLDWTKQLGDAVIAQQPELMTAIQAVRKKAYDVGNLKTTEQQTVSVQQGVVTVAPTNPQVIYVPTYNPVVIMQPPPPPPPGGQVAAGIIGFGAGLATAAIINNNCDWNNGGIHHGDVDIDVNRNVNINNNVNNTNISNRTNVNRSNVNKSSTWQPSAQAKTEYQGRRQADAKARNPGAGVKPANVGQADVNARERTRDASAGTPQSDRGAAARTAQPDQPAADRSAAQQKSAGNHSSGAGGGAFDRSGSSASETRRESARGKQSRGGGGARSGGGGRR